MKKFLIFVYKFIRGIFRFVFFVTIGIICRVIFIVNKEKNSENKITVKKAKRIRNLTNFKLKVWKTFPHLMRFLDEDKYLDYLNKKLNYGV